MPIPDAVALVIAYLDGLHTEQVSAKVPNPRPSKLIQVRRIGGGGLPPVRDVARLDVICWDDAGSAAASTLGTTVRAEMFALARTTTLGGVDCYRVEESLFRQFDDEETEAYRTWGTYALTLRANEIPPT